MTNAAFSDLFAAMLCIGKRQRVGAGKSLKRVAKVHAYQIQIRAGMSESASLPRRTKRAIVCETSREKREGGPSRSKQSRLGLEREFRRELVMSLAGLRF